MVTVPLPLKPLTPKPNPMHTADIHNPNGPNGEGRRMGLDPGESSHKDTKGTIALGKVVWFSLEYISQMFFFR